MRRQARRGAHSAKLSAWPQPSGEATPATTDENLKKVAEEQPVKAPKNTEAGSDEMSFPSAITAKFAGEKPAKARMHTCLEQYHANKAANTLGGTRWIEKGGGYYKQCNDRLKSGKS